MNFHVGFFDSWIKNRRNQRITEGQKISEEWGGNWSAELQTSRPLAQGEGKVSHMHTYTARCQQCVSNSQAFISASKVIIPLNFVTTF